MSPSARDHDGTTAHGTSAGDNPFHLGGFGMASSGSVAAPKPGAALSAALGKFFLLHDDHTASEIQNFRDELAQKFGSVLTEAERTGGGGPGVEVGVPESSLYGGAPYGGPGAGMGAGIMGGSTTAGAM